jgi:vacuolar-type H+-ATPase subunit I/STV1
MIIVYHEVLLSFSSLMSVLILVFGPYVVKFADAYASKLSIFYGDMIINSWKSDTWATTIRVQDESKSDNEVKFGVWWLLLSFLIGAVHYYVGLLITVITVAQMRSSEQDHTELLIIA